MNNSLVTLIDGMVATLRSEVIPQIATAFARGQVYGVIYMLNSIRLRAEWSSGFLREQLAAQLELRDSLAPLLAGLDAPALPKAATADIDSKGLEALRDANDGHVCMLIEWRGALAGRIDGGRARAIDAALLHYMNRQLNFELATSAKPMFAEMSAGAE